MLSPIVFYIAKMFRFPALRVPCLLMLGHGDTLFAHFSYFAKCRDMATDETYITLEPVPGKTWKNIHYVSLWGGPSIHELNTTIGGAE